MSFSHETGSPGVMVNLFLEPLSYSCTWGYHLVQTFPPCSLVGASSLGLKDVRCSGCSCEEQRVGAERLERERKTHNSSDAQ